MENSNTVLDDAVADLFDLDARTPDGNPLVVDTVTDNGCHTVPNCAYLPPGN